MQGDIERRTDESNRVQIDPDDGPRWMQAMLSALLDGITLKAETAAPALFPNGVTLIELSVSAGSQSAPLFNLSAKVAGPDEASIEKSHGGEDG